MSGAGHQGLGGAGVVGEHSGIVDRKVREGGAAMRQAVLAVKSGLVETALVIGVEDGPAIGRQSFDQLALAGLAVTAADPGGLWGAIKESSAVARGLVEAKMSEDAQIIFI